MGCESWIRYRHKGSNKGSELINKEDHGMVSDNLEQQTTKKT